VLEHCLRGQWQWGYVCQATVLCKWQATWHCAVQVASNMAFELQFRNLKHTMACVRA